MLSERGAAAAGLGVLAATCKACVRMLARGTRCGFPGGMNQLRAVLFAFMTLMLAGPAFAAAKPIPIKVVVVTTFEVGEAEGDRPGEFQFWAERLPLKTRLTVPGIEGPVRMSDDGVIGLVSGMRGRMVIASVPRWRWPGCWAPSDLM